MSAPDPIDLHIRHPVPVGVPRRRGIQRLGFSTAATAVRVPGVDPRRLLPPGPLPGQLRDEGLRLFEGRLWGPVPGTVAQAIHDLACWRPHLAPPFVAPAGYATGSWPDGPDSDGKEELLAIAETAIRERVATGLLHDGRRLYEALCVPHLKVHGERPVMSLDWRRHGEWVPTLPLGRPDLVEGYASSLPDTAGDPARTAGLMRAAAAIEAALREGFQGRTEGEDDVDAFFCKASISLASCLVSTRVRRVVPEGLAPGIGRLAALGSMGAILHDVRGDALGTIEATARFCVAEGSQPYVRDIASRILAHAERVIRPRLSTLRIDTTDDAALSTLVP